MSAILGGKKINLYLTQVTHRLRIFHIIKSKALQGQGESFQ